METTESTIKKPTTFIERVNILKSRNLQIEEEEKAIETLKRINYYRLSAYMLSFKSSDRFYDGVSFSDVYNLYNFDKKLRSLIMGVLETIEVAFRTHIAYLIAHKYGPVGYENHENFRNVTYHNKMIRKIQEEIDRSDEIFVHHHKAVYGGVFPIWVVIELVSFGLLSKIYSNLSEEDQNKIAREHYNTKGEYVRSWLYSLSVFRNICAHYGRLYNRRLKITPKLFRGDRREGINNNTVFSILITARRLQKNKNEWNHFVTDLAALIEENEKVDLRLMGFPDNWERILRNM
jgi:abortive infection bacteriophage resistance protein